MRMQLLWMSIVFAACAADSDTLERKKRPDAASVADASSTVDASSPTSSDQAGVVTCYRENDPTATCTSPSFCCFSNYSSALSGECRTDSCAWGTILCDGPEDCAGGQHCCSHPIIDPIDGIRGYMIACQTNACGAPPSENELCHPSTGCGDSRSCVTAYGTANSLPRTLYVCR